MELEVLNLIQAYFIGSPAIIGNCDTPVGWEVVLGVLVSEVGLCSQDDKWRDGLAEGINSLDYRCLFTVTRQG